MIVIYDKRFFRAANYALFCCLFDVLKMLIAQIKTKLASADFAAVRCTALPTPTVKAISLFIVWRKTLSCSWFVFFAARAS
jgi:hypothetical protein